MSRERAGPGGDHCCEDCRWEGPRGISYQRGGTPAELAWIEAQVGVEREWYAIDSSWCGGCGGEDRFGC